MCMSITENAFVLSGCVSTILLRPVPLRAFGWHAPFGSCCMDYVLQHRISEHCPFIAVWCRILLLRVVARYVLICVDSLTGFFSSAVPPLLAPQSYMSLLKHILSVVLLWSLWRLTPFASSFVLVFINFL